MLPAGRAGKTGEKGGGGADNGRTPPHPAGGYLIRGRKVGGHGGVRGVWLGTEAPGIHLDGGSGKERDVITKATPRWRLGTRYGGAGLRGRESV